MMRKLILLLLLIYPSAVATKAQNPVFRAHVGLAGSAGGGGGGFCTGSELLCDDFNDNSRDAAKWNATSGIESFNAAATVAETSARVEVTPPTSTAGANYNGYKSVNTFDFTGRTVQAKVVQVANSSSASTDTELYMFADASNWFRFIQEGGTLYFQRKQGGGQGTVASVAYNATNHLYWRIRESGGTVFGDVSPDGSSWTNVGSQAPGFTITVVNVGFEAGTYASEAAPGKAIFDDFKLF